MEKLKEIKEQLTAEMNDISVDFCEDYEAGYSDYICDAFSECADGNAGGGWYDMCDWLKDNYEDVEEALWEFGTPTNSNKQPDMEKIILQGQYLHYERKLYEDLENIVKVIAINYLIENKIENAEQIYEEIETDLERIDNNDRLEKIEELIEEQIKDNQDDENN